MELKARIADDDRPLLARVVKGFQAEANEQLEKERFESGETLKVPGFPPVGYFGKFCSHCKAKVVQGASVNEHRAERQPWGQGHWREGGITGDGSPPEEQEETDAANGQATMTSVEYPRMRSSNPSCALPSERGETPPYTPPPSRGSSTESTGDALKPTTPPKPPMALLESANIPSTSSNHSPVGGPSDRTEVPSSSRAFRLDAPRFSAIMQAHGHTNRDTAIGANSAASLMDEVAMRVGGTLGGNIRPTATAGAGGGQPMPPGLPAPPLPPALTALTARQSGAERILRIAAGGLPSDGLQAPKVTGRSGGRR